MNDPKTDGGSAAPRAGRARSLAGPAQFVASAGVLWLTFSLFDLEALSRRLEALRPGWVALGVALVWVQFALMAARWWFIARRLGVGLGYGRALREYALSALLNQVLPGGVVGDALRGYRHHKGLAGGSAERAGTRVVLALVLDRFSGQVALFMFVVGGTLSFWRAIELGPGARLAIAALPIAAGAAAVIAGALAKKRLWSGPLARVWHDGGRALFMGRNLGVHLSLSIALVALHLAVFWAVARALGIALGLSDGVHIVPLVMLVSSVPAFFAGWGIREAAAAALFHVSGLGAADGAGLSLVYGAVALIASVPGLLLARAQKAR